MHVLMKLTLGLLFSLMSTTAQAKNLEILWRSNIQNFELLDIFIKDDLAFIPAGLGGLNILDISNPTDPQVLSTYHAIGCDYGRMYAWVANERYAFGAGRDCGIYVLDVSNPASPRFITKYSDPGQSELRYEHVELQENYLYLSRHQGGVEIVEIMAPTILEKKSVLETENAWMSLAQDSLLFVADGAAGIKIYDVRHKSTPLLLSALQTSGTAKDLALYGKHLFVAVGAAGVDMIDISDLGFPVLRDNFYTGGYASRVSASEGHVAVSDWEDVEILSYTNRQMDRVGYKNSGGRVMAIAMVDDIIFSAEWEKLTTYKFGIINEPDIDFSTRILEFPRTPVCCGDTLDFRLENNGGTSLSITSSQVSNADYTIQISDLDILPGGSTDVHVVYNPASDEWKGELTLTANDPDEPVSTVIFSGNHDLGPMIGDPVPPFELQSVNGFGTISSESLKGRPVVIAFFTSW